MSLDLLINRPYGKIAKDVEQPVADAIEFLKEMEKTKEITLKDKSELKALKGCIIENGYRVYAESKENKWHILTLGISCNGKKYDYLIVEGKEK